MDPDRDLASWPHGDRSRMIRVRPHEWHVQQMGPTDAQAQQVLLLHGTGGATHSWRRLMPLLAKQCRVVAVDLPGHGFTRLGSRHRSGLNTMAQDLAALCATQGWVPDAIIGHSAGAAVALRLTGILDRPARIVALNPALQPFQGLAGTLFPMAARVLAMTPFFVDVALRGLATPGRVESLLAGTGSAVDPEDAALYAKLFLDRAHVDGTLLMMAQWKLDGLQSDLPRIDVPCLFLTGGGDRMVPPVGALEAARAMPDARVESFDGLGHLMHEEAPGRIAARILDWLR